MRGRGGPLPPRTSCAQARHTVSRHRAGKCCRTKGIAYTVNSANVWRASNGHPSKSSAQPWGKTPRSVFQQPQLDPGPRAGAGQPGDNGGHLNPDLQGRFHSFQPYLKGQESPFPLSSSPFVAATAFPLGVSSFIFVNLSGQGEKKNHDRLTFLRGTGPPQQASISVLEDGQCPLIILCSAHPSEKGTSPPPQLQSFKG